jgi:death-on-curing family protein
MIEIFCNGKARIATLSTEELLELHDILCKNYDLLPEMEPVSPPGVKNMNMLESAVSRQLVGSNDYYKYSNIYENCATLVFGIINNHPFHNGNKRTAFLALLKHLYVNGYVIRPFIQHKEIYELLRTLAGHTLQEHAQIYNKHFYKQHKNLKWSDEIQIKYLAQWLRQNTEYKNVKVRPKFIPVNELESILKIKNFTASFSRKYLTVSKKNSFFQDLFGKSSYKKSYLVKDFKNIPLSTIEQIRDDFKVSFQDGVDNSMFYNDEDILTNEIISYKRIIYKLAKT